MARLANTIIHNIIKLIFTNASISRIYVISITISCTTYAICFRIINASCTNKIIFKGI